MRRRAAVRLRSMLVVMGLDPGCELEPRSLERFGAMEWNISTPERTYLRELARKQAEYAALPVMAQRKQLWYDLNDGPKLPPPPFLVETQTFDRDFMPEGIFRCESRAGRSIERQLLRNTRIHELLGDDTVCPDFFSCGWFVEIDEFGVRIPRETRKDSQGVETGYRHLHPIKDLRRDLDLLRPARCGVDEAQTAAWRAFLEELLEGILPVRLCTGAFGATMLTHRVIELMGMEAYLLAIMDCPKDVHRLMAFLRDNALRVMHWAESAGLLRVNNDNQTSFGSSYNFTARLPACGYVGPAARLRDMWGCSNSQETVTISPGMFNEFCFPYYRDVCEPLGLVYYGCCEPVDPVWNDIRRLPHLKKVSISRWCDQHFMGEALRGTDIVFSRKPAPRFLGVDVQLDEDAWKAHIRETLEATRGVRVEFIVRDVYTVHGDLGKSRRAVELARAEIDRHYRA